MESKIKMNWWNLRNSQCPRCGHGLADGNLNGYLFCSSCDFKISLAKASAIISDLNTRALFKTGMRENEIELNEF
jgi:uncharacterized protein (DUF983 family)